MSVKDSDSHKLMYHPQCLIKWMNGEYVPFHAEVGITNKCNHKCKFCILDWSTHGKNEIDKDVFMNTLKEMAEMGVKSVYYAGEGEPTLHKNLVEFIKYGKQLGMGQAISTNGSLFNKKMATEILGDLSWLRFSIDAGTAETHALIHGISPKNYDIILQNIKDCVEIKKANNFKVDIGVQLILMNENINEAEMLALWCKNAGVDNFQLKPAHNHPKSSYSTGIYKFAHQTLKENLEKLEDDKFTVVVRVKSAERLTQEKNYTGCHGFDFYVIIDAKGDIIPCSIFYNSKYVYGNLYNNTFKEIWTSQKRKDIIAQINKLKFKTCKNYCCRLDVINRYLDRLKHPENNDEFI